MLQKFYSDCIPLLKNVKNGNGAKPENQLSST